MSSRKTYRTIFQILALFGLCFAAVPFISMLSTGDSVENNVWSSYYVGDMQPGKLQKFSTVWIYKRTADDKNYINRFVHFLEDPYSKSDRQPETARNVWRSENEGYFIFIPWSTRLGFTVHFSQDKKLELLTHFPEREALQTIPYFLEISDNRTWDMSGRLYKRKGNPAEQNLLVPKVKWKNKHQVLVYNRNHN